MSVGALLGNGGGAYHALVEARVHLRQRINNSPLVIFFNYGRRSHLACFLVLIDKATLRLGEALFLAPMIRANRRNKNEAGEGTKINRFKATVYAVNGLEQQVISIPRN